MPKQGKLFGSGHAALGDHESMYPLIL